MSYNITVEGGKSVWLKTAGKYCDRDIVVTSTGGDTQEAYDKGFDQGYIYGRSDGWNDALQMIEPTVKYYNGETNVAALPDGVTKIRGHAFRQQTLTSITGTDAVAIVDGYAFADCKSLTAISLPQAIRLYARCFYGCTSLASVNIPKVTLIENQVFYGCTSLASVEIPKVTLIQNQVFYGCTSLTSITFRSTPTSIAADAFSGCTNLKTINVPWAEKAVANAPWGATNATINFNYTEE